MFDPAKQQPQLVGHLPPGGMSVHGPPPGAFAGPQSHPGGVGEFMEAFHGGGAPPMDPMAHAARVGGVGTGAGAEAAEMAAEFARMNMRDPQVEAFENVYADMQRWQQRLQGPHSEAMRWSQEFQPQPHAAAGPHPHMMAHPHMMMMHRQAAAAAAAADMNAAWSESQLHPQQGPAQAAGWSSEFAQQRAAMQQQSMEAAFAESQSHAAKVSGQWTDEFVQQQQQQEQQQQQQQGMGGGLDRETIERLRNSDNPKWRNSKFIKLLGKISDGHIEFRDNTMIDHSPPEVDAESAQQQSPEDWAAEFDTQQFRAGQQPAMHEVFERAFAEHQPQAESLFSSDQWAEEFERDPEAWADNLARQQDEWAKEYMEQHPEQFAGENDFSWEAALAASTAEAGNLTRPDPEYMFTPENPFFDHPDPFGEAQVLLKEGVLKEAILALEAEVQRNAENADAWMLLGQAHAENEEETNAIAALLRCVRIDPYNLDALLMLGVSYTNDLEEARALNYLKTWLNHHPDYQGAAELRAHQESVREYEEYYGSESRRVDGALHAEVTKMFIKAASMNPHDVDLHTVLGVLYHIANDFDHAVEAFQHAVQLKADDPYLWNKLGATLANGSRSAEAVDAYVKALALKPNYVRASANLAISYANQGLHEQAAATYLATLRQNPNADHLWGYLRISLAHLGRQSLVQLSRQKDVTLFEPYFDF